MDLKFVVFGFVLLGARTGATQLELRRSERRRGPCVSLGSREELGRTPRASGPSEPSYCSKNPVDVLSHFGAIVRFASLLVNVQRPIFFTFMILQKEGNERAHDAFGRAVVRAPGDPKDQLFRT